MWLVVGLGNPGKTYEHTRHNVGFMALDGLAAAYGVSWKKQTKLQTQETRVRIEEQELILVKPQSYMNRSGEAVSLTSTYHHIETDRILVIHDDLDLPFGKIRIKSGGGSGGHHGVESIQKHLHTSAFYRIRVAIGDIDWFAAGQARQVYEDAVDYVLSPFSRQENKQLPEVLSRVTASVELICQGRLTEAMNRYN